MGTVGGRKASRGRKLAVLVPWGAVAGDVERGRLLWKRHHSMAIMGQCRRA